MKLNIHSIALVTLLGLSLSAHSDPAITANIKLSKYTASAGETITATYELHALKPLKGIELSFITIPDGCAEELSPKIKKIKQMEIKESILITSAFMVKSEAPCVVMSELFTTETTSIRPGIVFGAALNPQHQQK